MNLRRAEEIVQQPHVTCQACFRNDPTRSQPAESERLRQATRDYKVFAEVKRRPRRLFKHRLQVNLNHKHASANALRDLADLLQRRFVSKHAARIVQVCYHNQPRALGDESVDFFRVNPKTVFKLALVTFHIRAKEQRSCKHRFVCRLFKQYFITGLEQRSHCQVVRKTRSRRRYDRTRLNSIPRGEHSQQRRITITSIRQLKIVERHAQIANAQVA